MTCICVKDHNPNPTNFARHHILPRSWGGSDDAENLVVLCPTSHENVHTLLNHYVRLGGEPPWEIRRRYNAYVRELVERAWAQRGERTPYTGLMED